MSKEKHKKTNALRILDTHHIAYTIDEYEWSEERGQGVHVADELGLDEKEVFKTLVGKGDKTGYVVFCIPVAEELDMKQAARVSGNKSVELIHVKDLLGITGYLRGGCSPVGMKSNSLHTLMKRCKLKRLYMLVLVYEVCRCMLIHKIYNL